MKPEQDQMLGPQAESEAKSAAIHQVLSFHTLRTEDDEREHERRRLAALREESNPISAFLEYFLAVVSMAYHVFLFLFFLHVVARILE